MADLIAVGAPIKYPLIADGFECCITKECPYLSVYASALRSHLSLYHKVIEGFKQKSKY